MSEIPTKFVDEFLNIHYKEKELGKGGQGIVFRTKDPDIAIKLVINESGSPLSNKAEIKKYSQRLQRLRLLPLPDEINISLPAALLKNHAGYLMQLLNEMMPFSYFWLDKEVAEKMTEDDIPSWLSEIPHDEAKKLVHYYQTGGLRRRLIALYKCSSLLAQLHGNGLVYGDISPNNIFISNDLSRTEVWLIDADNLRFEILSGGSCVYTPRYGAPELVQGTDSGRPTSDCHAFAVVAFQILSLIHPFMGKKADGNDEETGDWADDENDNGDNEEKALAGLLPWVDDTDDDSNSASGGLPRMLLLNDQLTCLFQQTFQEGRINSLTRPRIYHWPEALAQAADNTIQCDACKMSWYYNIEMDSCPYCGESKPQILKLEAFHYTDKGKSDSPCWTFIHEIKKEILVIIPQRLTKTFSMKDSDFPVIEMYFQQKNILIKKGEQCTTKLSIAIDEIDEGRFQTIFAQTKIPLSIKNAYFWIYVQSEAPRLIRGSIIGGNT